jgi:hypothetical protein
MAQTLRLKRSSVAGRVPTISSLQTGEIAINTADGLVYIRKDDDTIIPLLGLNNVTTGNIYTTGSVVVLGNIRATSFEGGFTGSFSGSIDSPLSGIISGGTEGGFEEFTYDGRTSVSLSIDTGSAHFRDAVNEIASGSRALISVVDTIGSSGIDMTYDATTGQISASVYNPYIFIGQTEIELGQQVTSLDELSITRAHITGSFTGSLAGNLQGTASNATSASFATSALTASYALNVDPVNTGSLLADASISGDTITFTQGDGTTFDRVITSVATASSADNFEIRGDLTVDGIVTAQEFHTEFISASIVYESGSTKFGDSADDIHSFTGSLAVEGTLGITGFPDVSSSLASLQSTANPTLQTVTDNGSLTTNQISISSSLNVSQSIVSKGEDVLDFAIAMAIALG